MSIMTREMILRFWLSEPKIDPVPEGYIRLDFRTPCFPDLAELTPAERAAFRNLLAKHPEYLQYEVWCSKTIQ
jgi:hypothetical protein